jgi:hypothetical protein
MIGALLLVLASAVAYRIRGSDFLAAHTGGRLVKLAIGALPMCFGALMTGAPWWAAPFVLAGTMVADTQQHADCMGAGSVKECVELAAAGALAAVPAMLELAYDHPATAALALGCGLLKPAAYLVGNRLPIHLDRLELRRGPELGEFLYGAFRVLFALAH